MTLACLSINIASAVDYARSNNDSHYIVRRCMVCHYGDTLKCAVGERHKMWQIKVEWPLCLWRHCLLLAGTMTSNRLVVYVCVWGCALEYWFHSVYISHAFCDMPIIHCILAGVLRAHCVNSRMHSLFFYSSLLAFWLPASCGAYFFLTPHILLRVAHAAPFPLLAKYLLMHHFTCFIPFPLAARVE